MMKPDKSRKMDHGILPTKLQNGDFFFVFDDRPVLSRIWNYMSRRNSKKFKTGLDSNSSPGLD